LSESDPAALWQFLRKAKTSLQKGTAATEHGANQEQERQEALYWAKRLYRKRFRERADVNPLVSLVGQRPKTSEQAHHNNHPAGANRTAEGRLEAAQAARSSTSGRGPRGTYREAAPLHYQALKDLPVTASNLRKLALAYEQKTQRFRAVIGRSFFKLGCPQLPVVDIAGGGREGPFRFALDQQGAETSPAKLILIYQGLYHDHSLDTIMQLHGKKQILADKKTKTMLENFPTKISSKRSRGSTTSKRTTGDHVEVDVDPDEDDFNSSDEDTETQKISFSGHFPDNYPVGGREETIARMEKKMEEEQKLAEKDTEYDRTMKSRIDEMELHYMLLRDRWVARFPQVVRLTGEDAITFWDEMEKPIRYPRGNDQSGGNENVQFLKRAILRKYEALYTSQINASSAEARQKFYHLLFHSNPPVSQLRNLYRFLYHDDAAPSRLLPPGLVKPFLVSECGSPDYGESGNS
ncbi:unnamed protein product, partial [Amoebophrya sp. A120]